MPSKDVSAMMAQDLAAQSRTPSNQEMKELTDLVSLMQLQEKEVDALSTQLDQAKTRLMDITMERIPNLFDQLGLSEIKLSSGEAVSVKRSFAAHISQKNWDAAVKWLRDHGHEAIVKHDLNIKLKKGDEDQRRALIRQLDEQGLTYADKESVHPQTLKAFVTEQIESGADIPMDVFGVHPIRTTKVS